MIDVAVVGGGPAGMAAALVAGRGKKEVVLFDEEMPRNRVTHEAHAYLTRDGISPAAFREAGRKDLEKYPTIFIEKERIASIEKTEEGTFELVKQSGETLRTKRVILATGLKESLPEVPGIHSYYGQSVFSCPFCDGWEMRDRPLVVFLQTNQAFHLVKLLKNWSNEITVATNGAHVLDEEQKALLKRNGVGLREEPVKEIKGRDGQIESVVFESGEEVVVSGGFCEINLEDATPFVSQLGIELNDRGFVETDQLGRTNVAGVFAAGESTGPSQLIVSASQGHMAGAGIVFEEAEEGFKD